jgi:PAS domain S-box-containing protein
MKTKTKVVLLILIPVVLSLFTVTGLIWMQKEIRRGEQVGRLADEIVHKVFELDQVVSQNLLYPEERPRVQFRSIHDSLKNTLARFSTKTAQEDQSLREMIANQKDIGFLFPLITGEEGKQAADLGDRFYQEYKGQVTSQLLIKLRETVSDGFQLMKSSGDRINGNVQQVNRLMITVILIAGLAMMLLAGFIGQAILQNTKDLQREIDDRRRVEKDLRTSEERLRRVAHAGRIGFYEWDTHQDQAYWSPEAYDLFGREPTYPTDFEGWMACVHPADRERVAGSATKLLEQARAELRRVSQQDEYRVVHGDGTVLWLEARTVFDLDSGNLVMRGAVRDISERKRMEMSLRENEATLRGILDAVKESIWLFSPEGLVLLANSTAFSRYPLQPAEVIGRSFTEILPAELAQSRLAKLREVVESARAVEFEDWRAGILFQHNFYPVLDEQGQVKAVVSFSRDITENRRIEEALRESERRFRLALRNAPVSVAVQDRDLIYRWAYNQRTARAEEIIGKGDTDIFTPEEAAHVTAIKRRVLEEGVEVREQMWLNRPGGRIFLDVFLEPICDEVGRVTGVGSATVDLTSLRLVEEALRQAHLRLVLAQQSAGAGIWDWDMITEKLEWSPEMFRLFGLDPSQATATFETWRRLVHPEDLEEAEERLREAVRDRVRLENEYRIILDSGEERWINALGDSDFDVGGQPRRMSGICLDITERKRAEKELREREGLLRASLDEKVVLLKEIHHRVKNNLQVISSLVSLQAEELQDKVSRTIFQDLTHRVRSMALVHEKLYQSPDLARVEFAEYTRSLLHYLWRAYGTEASGIRLNQDLEPVSLSVNTAVPFGLILNELVINALKHAFPGRTGGEVMVSLRGGAPGRVSLCVRDNGTGLPVGFDWRQTRSLGLRLVQLLAGQLHAAVEVSGVGGTEFKIAFEGREQEKVNG